MKIKKYIVRSMPEAMSLIKKDLGNDAVILNSKEIKTGGFLGMFKKKNFEVIAALDETSLPVNKSKQIVKEIPVNLPKVNVNKQQNEVLDELKYLRELIASQSFQSEHQFPAEFEHLYQFLLEQEVSRELAKEMIDSMMMKIEVNETVSNDQLKLLLKNEIVSRLSGLSFDGIHFDKQQIIQFIGPTGVGKTTTLAKVAALSILQHEKKIAFITADTYRIAAIDQLKTYARILDVPIEVAYTISDYKNALQKFKDFDLVFVDTAGRNFRDERYVKELKDVIAFEQFKVSTYLVLSLTAKAQDVIDIYGQFEQIPIEKVIFTKVDETLSYGSILNVCINENIAVAHFTNGQNVPDDIVQANPSFISELIARRYSR